MGAEGSERARDKMAAEVAGISFLAELPGATANLRPETSSGKQWRKLLEQSKRPMRPKDRIGLRTTELWVLPSEESAVSSGDEDDGLEPERFMTVSATCQQSSVKDFSSFASAFRVMLLEGAKVAEMRRVLNRIRPFLPAKANIFAEKAGGRQVTLQDTDELPEKVTVSEFKGKSTFYTEFTKRQTISIFRRLRSYLKKPERQEQLSDFRTQCTGKSGEFNTAAYKSFLAKILSTDAYPDILFRVGVPQEELQNSLSLVIESMVWQTEDGICDMWFECEVLMRNQDNALGAYRLMKKYQMERGRPDLPEFSALCDQIWAKCTTK
eukprot:gnl/TRDRNA2_/TRDRNA2_151748_c1_seq2.p1 gnl/TRDRNA2_/TRDRNA2_151748_c1~~gnl/TRDRNA2_/TRDRNA2_151748_c1_seq2.p1  ORF type:complete len:381 (-),score=74.79 gnl/TRDRNA2_/TRDRNA2_151748_c1_seq2:8-979(-)